MSSTTRPNRRKRVDRYFECVCKKQCRTYNALIQHITAPNASLRCRPLEQVGPINVTSIPEIQEDLGYDSSTSEDEEASQNTIDGDAHTTAFHPDDDDQSEASPEVARSPSRATPEEEYQSTENWARHLVSLR